MAAHYTAEPDDQIVIRDTDVVKIDLGVHIDGYVADTAVTISYDSKYDPLIKIAELSLYEVPGLQSMLLNQARLEKQLRIP